MGGSRGGAGGPTPPPPGIARLLISAMLKFPSDPSGNLDPNLPPPPPRENFLDPRMGRKPKLLVFSCIGSFIYYGVSRHSDTFFTLYYSRLDLFAFIIIRVCIYFNVPLLMTLR